MASECVLLWPKERSGSERCSGAVERVLLAPERTRRTDHGERAGERDTMSCSRVSGATVPQRNQSVCELKGSEPGGQEEEG